MPLLNRYLLIGVLFFSATPLFAQNDSTHKAMDTLVVGSQRVSQALKDVPFTVEVLQAKDLTLLNSRTTPEALMQVPGVFVQKTNHGGGSPFVRGLTGNQTLLLVDGIRMNNSIFRYGPNQYLNTIDPFTIGQVEVVKGTGSVQYGSDALGGVIQVQTQDPAFAVAGRTLRLGGTGRVTSRGMEQSGRGVVRYSGQKTAFTGGLTRRHFGHLVGGDTTGLQNPSGYNELAFDAKAKMRMGESAVLTVAHQQVRQTGVPIYHKVVLEDFAFNNTTLQLRQLSYAALRVPTRAAWANMVNITASWQQGVEERESRKNGSNTQRNERDAVGTAGLTVDLHSRIAQGWTATSGVELYHDRVHSSRTDINTVTAKGDARRGLYPEGAGYGNYSLFSLHHFGWRKWKAEAGVRYNVFDIRISDTTLGKVRLTPDALVYNAGLLYQLDARQGVFANFSTGYRAPNVDDMGTLGVVDFRYEVPAAGLAPERSRHTELGYRYADAGLSFQASLYYLGLHNLITRVKMEGQVINGYNVYQKENVESAYVKGAEASLGWEITRSLSVRGGLAYAYGKNVTRNEPLRRTPPLNGRMLLHYHRKGWHGAFELAAATRQDRLAKGDREDNRIPQGGTPGWQVLNLAGGYRWKSISLNAGVNNLADVDYRTHGSGINGMGRSVWCALSVGM